MTIQFRCEHCGKKVEAPDSAGGKRGRCPYCKGSNYIPAPVSDEEVYDFAAEDEAEAKRAAEEEARLRAQEEALLSETGGAEPSVPLEHREDVSAEDVQHLVVNYCLDMAASKLERAGTHVAELQKAPEAARQAVAGFLTGQLIEAALDPIPKAVLDGFLKELRAQL